MRPGVVDPLLVDEFPDLRLWTDELPAGWQHSTREVRDELRRLSNRFGGAQALALRQQPIPQAFRVFFRHIGLDPDETRPPAEAVALERMRAGHFSSTHLVSDATTIALIHTGVPLWALDADRIAGELRLRPARSGGEPIGDGRFAVGGRLLVADDDGPVAVLFGDAAADRLVTRSTRRTLLYTVQIRGVPSIHVEEAVDQVRAWVLGE